MNIKSEIMKEYHKMAKFYDLKTIFKFLELLRQSGVVNMMVSYPYLYLGKERIEHEHKYTNKNEDEFNEVLDMSEDIRNVMIRGVFKHVDSKRKGNTEDEDEDDDRYLRSAESQMRKDALDIFKIWQNFKGKVIKEMFINESKYNKQNSINFLIRRVTKSELDAEFHDTIEWCLERPNRSIPFENFLKRFITMMIDGIHWKLIDGFSDENTGELYDNIETILTDMYRDDIYDFYREIYD
jgi:hypothetical protein